MSEDNNMAAVKQSFGFGSQRGICTSTPVALTPEEELRCIDKRIAFFQHAVDDLRGCLLNRNSNYDDPSYEAAMLETERELNDPPEYTFEEVREQDRFLNMVKTLEILEGAIADLRAWRSDIKI